MSSGRILPPSEVTTSFSDPSDKSLSRPISSGAQLRCHRSSQQNQAVENAHFSNAHRVPQNCWKSAFSRTFSIAVKCLFKKTYKYRSGCLKSVSDSTSFAVQTQSIRGFQTTRINNRISLYDWLAFDAKSVRRQDAQSASVSSFRFQISSGMWVLTFEIAFELVSHFGSFF